MRERKARKSACFVAPLAIVLAAVLGSGCGVRTAEREAFPALAEFEGREIERVVFVNPEPFSEDTLARVVETEPSHCSLLGLPICLPFGDLGEQERRLDLAMLLRDVRRLELFYRQSGFFGTRVTPVVEPEEEGDRVEVSFVITRGDPIYVDTLIVAGTEGIVDPVELKRRLPLREGELFDLGEYAASADTIRRALLDLGHAYADVLRNYTVDTTTDLATASLVAVPGPRVIVDSIIVLGAEHLGRGATLRQLTFEEGDVLRAQELVESQRNLYSLELVQFATVTIAEDTLQAAPGDSTRATVVVRISEAPVHEVEAAIGYGSVDCFRAQTRWVSRSFGGGARRLALTGMVSKIGIGAPLDAGFGGSICRAFEGDPFRDDLDYRFSADLTQPWFVSPRNHLTLSAFVERQSEPAVFQRDARGGRLAVARRLAPRSILTASVDVERGRTLAREAVFCAAFLVCRPTDIAELSQRRWKNSLGLSWVLDRTNRAIDPTEGYLVRTGGAWAAPWLGSEVDFFRSTFEGSRYRMVDRGWVFATHLRVGSFFGTATLDPGGDFVPPEERFYAGGATSVRGFARNELGPGVYVGDHPVFDSATIRFIPIGGTSVVVANAELRTPSPFLRGHLGFAVFVDAGAVDDDEPWELDGSDWRITPGVGVRLQTPVGPVRADVAYNPYAPRRGPLFLPENGEGGLIRVMDDFRLERGGFWRRFRVHVAVGQPF